jgi:hypothetical protein
MESDNNSQDGDTIYKMVNTSRSDSQCFVQIGGEICDGYITKSVSMSVINISLDHNAGFCLSEILFTDDNGNFVPVTLPLTSKKVPVQVCYHTKKKDYCLFYDKQKKSFLLHSKNCGTFRSFLPDPYPDTGRVMALLEISFEELFERLNPTI